MRTTPRSRRDSTHLVTDARRSLSEDISYREKRYLLMMGFRVLCFALAVVLYVHGAGWFTAIPAVGAIIIPYFAVIFANGGREPDRGRSFQAHEPRLPALYSPPSSGPADTPIDISSDLEHAHDTGPDNDQET